MKPFHGSNAGSRSWDSTMENPLANHLVLLNRVQATLSSSW